jgi:tight adherence protein C
MMAVVAAIFWGAATAMAWSVLSRARQDSVARALARGTLAGDKARKARHGFGQLAEDLARDWAERLEAYLPAAWRGTAQEYLSRAGRRASPGDWVLASLALGALLAVGLALAAGWMAAGAGLLLGLALPWLRLRDQAHRRLEEIQGHLPDAVDLLCTAVSAGMAFEQSLARVLPLQPRGALRSEMEKAASDMRLGRGRQEALRAMQMRLHCHEASELVLALIQCDQQGLPLAPVLRAQAGQVRVLRGLRAQKRAAVAPLKLLFPLMVFILPVVFLVLLGPIYLAWTRGGL